MNNILLKHLANFGLSEKEAQIYLALLELETATVFEAAKQSGINRSSAYVVLEALKKKGLVGISDDKNVRRYIAASPETLLYAAKTAAKKQENIKSEIESIIPELKALYKGTKKRPVVKVFEGENGARQTYLDILSTKSKQLRTYANPINIFKRIPDFAETFDKNRSQRGIEMRAINPETKEIIEFYKHIKAQKPSLITLIPKDKFNFSSDLGIYENKVTLVSPNKNFGIIIESQEIADMLKNVFDLAWEEAKRLNKKIMEGLRKKSVRPKKGLKKVKILI